MDQTNYAPLGNRDDPSDPPSPRSSLSNPSVSSQHPPPSQHATSVHSRTNVRNPSSQRTIRGSVDSDSTTSSVPTLKDRIKVSVAPWVHDKDHLRRTSNAHSTAREYNEWSQSKRLWRLATGEWLITLILCGVYAGILAAFEVLHALGPVQRSYFNGLVTTLTFFLGVNLSASLRSYAKLLRWLLLSQQYRPLSVFDLILSCDSIFNVIKLIPKTRNKNHRYLFSRTQMLCFAWLLLNLAMPLAIGAIGITYNMTSTPDYNLIKDGNVTFMDLSVFDSNGSSNINIALKDIQTWGMKGFNAAAIPQTTHKNENSDKYEYETYQNGTTQYYFRSYDPYDNTTSAISFRKIKPAAQCEEWPVTYGETGTLAYFTAVNSTGPYNVTFHPGTHPGPGGLAVWSGLNMTCGERCSCVNVFLAKSTPGDEPSSITYDRARYFKCNNTVPLVKQWRQKVLYNASDEYQFSPNVSRMLAGAMGWSGQPFQRLTSLNESLWWNTMTYTNFTTVARHFGDLYGAKSPNGEDMADFISSFTTKAVVAMDDLKTGLNSFKTAYGRVPVSSQKLVVDWRNTSWLLVIIPLIQFAALIIVFRFANKAIIKDESPLSIAKLYFSLLRDHEFDQQGCMLRGEEIAKAMGDPMVTYGWVANGEVNGNPIGHLDVFESTEQDDNGACLPPLYTETGRLIGSDMVEEVTIARHTRPLGEGEKVESVSNVYQPWMLYDGAGGREKRPKMPTKTRHQGFNADDLFG